MALKRKSLYKLIIFLSIVGLLTSTHLINVHINGNYGAVCDINEQISCSLVDGSKYSEMFNVPVAIFGAIWFIVLIVMSWRALKSEKAYHVGVLLWNIIGLFSVFYLIWAEFMLGAICTYCTIVHIIILITFIISIKLAKTGENLRLRTIIRYATPWFILILLISSLPIAYYNLDMFKSEYDDFAQCLTEKGVKLYSSYACPVCVKQKRMFGDAFDYINNIECHPSGENSQSELCIEKEIEALPTWVLEKDGKEVKRLVGYQSYEDLVEAFDCE